jgi:hypothetical protein
MSDRPRIQEVSRDSSLASKRISTTLLARAKLLTSPGGNGREKKKEKVAITLRVEADVHRQLRSISRELFIDLNALLNLMIRRSLGQIALEAEVYKKEMDLATTSKGIFMLVAWEKANPGRPPTDFRDELREYLMTKQMNSAGEIVEQFKNWEPPDE